MSRKSLFALGFPGVACALILVLSAPLFAWQEDEPEPEFWEKTTDSWFEPVAEGGTIRVDNPFGAIYVRFGGYESKAEILGTSQRLEPDLPPLVVHRETVEGDLHVDVRIEGVQPGGKLPPRRDRIDLVLFAPIGRKVEVTTVDDPIGAKGLRGDLVVRSIKGDVTLRKIEGAVDVRTERGEVRALLESGVTKSDQRFESITGDIEVTVYEDADLDVSIATSGVISTDFSLQIEHRRFEEPGKYAHAVVNGGGPKLTIRSRRGRVSLLRQQKFFTKDENEGSS